MYVYFCRVGSLSKIHQSNQNLRLGLFLGSCVLHERGFAAIGINVKRRFCSIRSKYFVKVSRKSVKECQIIVMLRSDISFFFRVTMHGSGYTLLQNQSFGSPTWSFGHEKFELCKSVLRSESRSYRNKHTKKTNGLYMIRSAVDMLTMSF